MSPAANRSRRGALPIAMRLGLGLGFVLAASATVLVVFTEEVRWLRFAVVLGLWAALIAAFAVTFFRRVARAAEQKTEESKRTYELELHREISARREYEIGVSEAAREDAETRHREELAGLREQLDRLNTTLSGLLDGDLLFERLTLSAESTRVRQVGAESGRGRLAAMARPGQIEHAPEPTGPYVGQQSGAPMAAGPPFGPPVAPVPQYPVREDDTVQFPRATFGPGAPPVAGAPLGPPVVEAVAEPEVVVAPEPVADPEPAVQPVPVAEPVADPEPVVQPEPVAEPEPEPVVLEPVAEPEPEPVSLQPEPEPELVVEESAPAPVVDEPEPEPVVEEPEPEPVVEEPVVAAAVPTFSEPVQAVEEDTPPEHADSGTGHSAGISVADLLAAYGAGEGTPRRRRRAED